jgi:hypothetical protein
LIDSRTVSPRVVAHGEVESLNVYKVIEIDDIVSIKESIEIVTIHEVHTISDYFHQPLQFVLFERWDMMGGVVDHFQLGEVYNLLIPLAHCHSPSHDGQAFDVGLLLEEIHEDIVEYVKVIHLLIVMVC